MNDLPLILKDLRAGKMMILTDGSDREDEGDLVMAAELVTPKAVTFMAKFGSGLICVPLTLERAQKLNLPPMVLENTSSLKCNFSISVDARKGVTTGISASDRAKTIQLLAKDSATASDLSRPGHVFPLVKHTGGVLARAGHTEGSLELMKLAGLKEVAVICEIMGEDGEMLRGRKLREFAGVHSLRIFSIEELKKRFSWKKIINGKIDEALVRREVTARLPTPFGEFKIIAYRHAFDGKEHLALVKGKILKKVPVLVRIHSECLTGDVFHSTRCDCQDQLSAALRAISKKGSGVLLYLRHEGRGIGLVNKLKSYNLQDHGLDTVEANEKLGFSADLRDYTAAAHMLRDLGAARIALMTNNPLKIKTLENFGFHSVERIPLEVRPQNFRQRRYLQTKKMKLGHMLGSL